MTAVNSAESSSPLRRLDPPPRLFVPLQTRAGGEVAPMLTIGSSVAKGQRLVGATANAGPAVLAPTSGRIVGTATVPLTNGQVVPALELECDFEDRAAPEGHD